MRLLPNFPCLVPQSSLLFLLLFETKKTSLSTAHFLQVVKFS